MRNLKRSVFWVVVFNCLVMVTGCDKQPTKEQGELRHKLFVECMELAAKNGRSGDDDVSDIVGRCDNVAYYQSIQIMQ